MTFTQLKNSQVFDLSGIRFSVLHQVSICHQLAKFSGSIWLYKLSLLFCPFFLSKFTAIANMQIYVFLLQKMVNQ